MATIKTRPCRWGCPHPKLTVSRFQHHTTLVQAQLVVPDGGSRKTGHSTRRSWALDEAETYTMSVAFLAVVSPSYVGFAACITDDDLWYGVGEWLQACSASQRCSNQAKTFPPLVSVDALMCNPIPVYPYFHAQQALDCQQCSTCSAA